MLETILMVDIGSYATPITMTYTVIEKVIGEEPPKAPLTISKQKKEKFDKMSKEDFYKNDPYADMWDKNWTSNIEPTQTVEVKPIEVKPVAVNKPKPPVVVKKKVKSNKHKVKRK